MFKIGMVIRIEYMSTYFSQKRRLREFSVMDLSQITWCIFQMLNSFGL